MPDDVHHSTATEPALAAELTAMADADLALARAAMDRDDPGLRRRWRQLTVQQGERLVSIVEEHGWPTDVMVGARAAEAARTIATHADGCLALQRRALEIAGEALAEERARRRLETIGFW